MHRLGPVDVADYHIAGQPFRIVTGGVPQLEGGDALERRAWAEQHLDDIRRLVANEPRGYSGTQGCFVAKSGEPGVDLDVVFFDQGGFGAVSGHGAIALTTWAVESGIVPLESARLVIDAPSGQISAVADVEDGKARSISYTSGTAYVSGRFIPVQLRDTVVSVDIAYAGMYLAVINAGELDIALSADNADELVRLGREIGMILADNKAVVHPTDHRLSGFRGTVFYEDGPAMGAATGPVVRQRAVTVAADGRIGRSPSGTGTSACIATLDSLARLPRGTSLIHESLIGTALSGRVVGDGQVGGIHGVVTQIRGSAYRIGEAKLWLDDLDSLGLGFQFA
jgi:proline racemase